MSITAPPESAAEAPTAPAASATAEPTPDIQAADEERPISTTLVGLSTLFSVAAVAWMFAGVFDGSLARVVGVLAAAFGVGVTTLSYRTSRPSVLQYLTPAVGAGIGALLALSSAPSGHSNPISLISSALHSGGISHPPVSFDPGWRFILFFLITALGCAATTLAVSLDKPKLGVMLPAPLIFLGALVQPAGATLTSSTVALVLFIASFGAAHGVDLAREGANSGTFETRRVLRGGGILIVLVGVLIALSQSGFLLPKANDHSVIPPQFPQTPSAPPNGVLFSVDLPQPVPLRLGVLDVYRGSSWLTPPFDPATLQTLKGAAPVAAGSQPGDAPLADVSPTSPKDQHVTFTMGTIGGHLLPDVASPLEVPHSADTLQVDPRTQELRLPDALVPHGYSYTVVAPPIASAAQLSAAGGPTPASLMQYEAAPAEPAVVRHLLAKAPTSNAFERLQYVRNYYYEHVIASGPGNPVPVSAARVGQILAGKPASPFEIVAGEALLARWAGVPSRIGYGYYSTAPDHSGSTQYDITSLDGASWLEAYFNHYGWVPIVGTPPRAQASLDNHPKQKNPAIIPSGRLDLVVYVPIKQPNPEALFVILRYFMLRLLPLLALLVALWLFFPGPVKIARGLRRGRWSADRGPRETVAVAYAELRDGATDLNIGDPVQTPLEFLEVVDADPEHAELAWLVTRVMWGDLARDARPEDAELAVEMSASVLKRLQQASPALNRVIAFGSRASLRDPYSDELPNLWPSWHLRDRFASGRRRLIDTIRLRPLRRLLRAIPGTAVALLTLIGVAGCASSGIQLGSHPVLPARIAPATLGSLTFIEQAAAETNYAAAGSQSLIATGRIYSIKEGGIVRADLQVASFKPQYSALESAVKHGVIFGIAGNAFQLSHVGNQLVYVANKPQEQLLLWFPPDGRYYVLIDSQSSFTQDEPTLLALLSYEAGGKAVATTGIQPLDPRQGGDYSEESQ
jgi:hypothetical protein